MIMMNVFRKLLGISYSLSSTRVLQLTVSCLCFSVLHLEELSDHSRKVRCLHRQEEYNEINTRNLEHFSSFLPYTPCFTQKPSCLPNSKYRTIDGSCNNLNHLELGMVNTLYGRLVSPNYADGIFLPRISTDGSPLPSPRKLVTTFFVDENHEDMLSSTWMIFGQFLGHDVLLTSSRDGKSVDCCKKEEAENKDACLPIKVPIDDPFYSQFGVSCLSMLRNKLISRDDCSKIALQANSVTHFMDGSQIYGSTVEVAKSIREFRAGRLLAQSCQGRGSYLPTSKRIDPCNANDNITYLAGDIRVSQSPILASIHTLLLREHNRIAAKVQHLHPDWNDEIVYQETRAIVVAELQHIIYNEWLPPLLGKSYMVHHGLYSNIHRDYTYNPDLIPVTAVEFASVFRVGHSAVHGKLNVASSLRTCPRKQFNFSDFLGLPGLIQQPTLFEGVVRGLMQQPMQQVDEFYTNQISDLLFHGKRPFGSDLISIDIQRGRDHGLATYVEYYYKCTNTRLRTFSDLKGIIKPKFISSLEQLYKSVNDIDLFVGGNLEIRASGSIVGPTFQCILGQQFYRYKYGDRFWYEIRGLPHSFSNGQLFEIKRITLSKIICDNSKITEVARNSFLVPSLMNEIVSCDELPGIDLNRWR